MEKEQHPDQGGGQPEANSYGTDDPEIQARIEQARSEASEQRKRDRARLEQLVEGGMRPDDAEALIEFEHFVQDQREQTAQTQRATALALEAAAGNEPTSVENTRRDLTDLLALRDRADGAAALAEFAASTRQNAGRGASQMPSDPAAVARYQAAGLDRRDALTVAGFEYFLRDKLRAAGDPAADLGSEQREHVVRFQPRVYVAVDEPDVNHGAWVNAAQSAEDLRAGINAMVESSPVPGNQRWKVTDTDDFAGLPVRDLRDSELISAFGRGVAEHGVAFAAWVSVQGTDDRDMLERFADFYVGRYRDERDWAESIAVDLEWLDQLDQVVDPALRPYVMLDYDKIAREARAGWDVVTGLDGRVYVFLR